MLRKRRSFFCNIIDGDLQTEERSRTYQEVTVGERNRIENRAGDSLLSDFVKKKKKKALLGFCSIFSP